MKTTSLIASVLSLFTATATLTTPLEATPSLLLAQRSCSVSTFGPAGGGGGVRRNFELPNTARIRSITINSGSVIDRIGITYITSTGQSGSFRVGGTGGNRQDTISFSNNEFITGISGRAGFFVDSLTIHTNIRRYGPYGGSGGNSFSFPVPRGSTFGGFVFRSSNLIDAIGLRAETCR